MSTKNLDDKKYPVIIVGGGPVGLFLAIGLHHFGIECKVLEQRTRNTAHSKSIGIHPRSLELFDTYDLTDAFLSEGLQIKRGHAFVNRRHVGSLTFESLPGPYKFILTIPQFSTEYLLERILVQRDTDILHKGMTVEKVQQKEDEVQLHCRTNLGEEQLIRADFVIGCDGKNSQVRKSTGISFRGGAYPDTYIMGDFTDNTPFKSDAAIFLNDNGLIESFPLPVSIRRWVIKTDEYFTDVERTDIEARIMQRLGHDLSHTENFMLSSFGVQHYLADRYYNGRVILAGDSAHIISPIGGQGMNLGWLDAEALINILRTLISDPEQRKKMLHDYEKNQRGTAKKAMRRSEFNMRMGRHTRSPLLKKAVVKTMLTPPLKNLTARLFAMHGLDKWPI